MLRMATSNVDVDVDLDVDVDVDTCRMTTMERISSPPGSSSSNTILVTTAVRGESLPPPTSLHLWTSLLPTGRRGG